jgi:hypothetical protein
MSAAAGTPGRTQAELQRLAELVYELLRRDLLLTIERHGGDGTRWR